MSDQRLHRLLKDEWDGVSAFPCPECAALILSEPHLEVHMKWHADTNVEIRRSVISADELDVMDKWID